MQAGLAVRPLKGARNGLGIVSAGPAFRYANAVSQSIASSALTKVVLGTKVFDTDNSVDAANNRFVARQAGVFSFSGRANLVNTTGAATIGDALGAFYKNGALYTRLSQIGATSASSGIKQFAAAGSAEIDLQVGEFVELYAFATVTAGGLIVDIDSFLSGHFVRPLVLP